MLDKYVVTLAILRTLLIAVSGSTPVTPTSLKNQRILVPTQHKSVEMNNSRGPYSIIQFKLYEDYLDSKLTEMDLVHLKVSYFYYFPLPCVLVSLLIFQFSKSG